MHDQSRVFVALFRKGVEFSNSIIESLLGKVACTVRAVKDLVVEDGEVKGKTETDGVGRGQAGGGDLSSSLVGLERLVGRGLALVADGELGKVTVVVTLPVTKVSLCSQCRYRGSRWALTSCGRTPWTRRSRQRG